MCPMSRAFQNLGSSSRQHLTLLTNLCSRCALPGSTAKAQMPPRSLVGGVNRQGSHRSHFGDASNFRCAFEFRTPGFASTISPTLTANDVGVKHENTIYRAHFSTAAFSCTHTAAIARKLTVRKEMQTARWETARAANTLAPQKGGCNGLCRHRRDRC